LTKKAGLRGCVLDHRAKIVKCLSVRPSHFSQADVRLSEKYHMASRPRFWQHKARPFDYQQKSPNSLCMTSFRFCSFSFVTSLPFLHTFVDHCCVDFARLKNIAYFTIINKIGIVRPILCIGCTYFGKRLDGKMPIQSRYNTIHSLNGILLKNGTPMNVDSSSKKNGGKFQYSLNTCMLIIRFTYDPLLEIICVPTFPPK
jgi:hypothetical protein